MILNFDDDFGHLSVQEVNQLVTHQSNCTLANSSCYNNDENSNINVNTGMDDSHIYISKLEKKLERIKRNDSKRCGNTSRGILHSLQEIKEAQLKAMIAEDINLPTNRPDVYTGDDPLPRTNYCCLTFAYTRLYPEKQAISNVEVDCLLDHDEVDDQHRLLTATEGI